MPPGVWIVVCCVHVYICVFLAVCCVVLCGALFGFGLVCVRLAWFSLVAWFALSCFVVFVLCCFVMGCSFVWCVCVVCVALLIGLFCVIMCVHTKGSRPAGCMFQARPFQDAALGVC